MLPHSHFHVTFRVDRSYSGCNALGTWKLAVFDSESVSVKSPEHAAKVINNLHTPNWCIVIHMTRTNIDIDDSLVKTVMMRYNLTTKREAVDHALRHLVGTPMSTKEIGEMFGAFPDFEIPSDVPLESDQ